MYLLYNIIAFCAGAIIGVVLTACIVAADWHEKPRRHRGLWIVDEEGHAHCPRCGGVIDFANHEPTDYCPICGAEMKGVKIDAKRDQQ